MNNRYQPNQPFAPTNFGKIEFDRPTAHPILTTSTILKYSSPNNKISGGLEKSLTKGKTSGLIIGQRLTPQENKTSSKEIFKTQQPSALALLRSSYPTKSNLVLPDSSSKHPHLLSKKCTFLFNSQQI